MGIVIAIIGGVFKLIFQFLEWGLRKPAQFILGITAVTVLAWITHGHFDFIQLVFAFGVGCMIAASAKFWSPHVVKWGSYVASLFGGAWVHRDLATAAWASSGQVKRAGLLSSNGLLLGRKTFLPILRWNGDGNVLTVAPAGAGKGVGVILPNLLLYSGPVVVTDPKGENCAISAKARQSMGHRVLRLDPFDVCKDVEAAERATLNPFDLLDVNDRQFSARARTLAEALVIKTGQEQNPFWNTSAINMLQGLIMYIACAAPKPYRHLGEVRRMLTFSPPEWNDLLQRMCNVESQDGTPIPRFVREQVRSGATSIAGMDPATRANIVISALQHVSFLDSPDVIDSVSHSSFDVRDIKRTGSLSLFMILPTAKLTAYAPLMRLWITVLVDAVVEVPGRPEKRILFLLDEMAQLGRMEPLKQAASLMRGYGMTLWMVFQDLGQLKSIYPNDEWKTFVSNSTVQQYFSIADPETAEHVSKMLGDQMLAVTNTGTSTHDKGDTSSTSVQKQTRPLMRPDEILRMPRTQQIIFVQGCAPLKTTKLCYYADQEFAGLFDVSPMNKPVI